MAIKVYAVKDREAIDLIECDDIVGFKDYLLSNPYLNFGEPEYFTSEDTTLAFCAALGYGVNDHGPVDVYPLRSSEEADIPFIRLIEAFENGQDLNSLIYVVYELTNPDLYCALVNEELPDFCELIRNGQGGRIEKHAFSDRDDAEEFGGYVAASLEGIPLFAYDKENKPYVDIIEEYKCYSDYTRL